MNFIRIFFIETLNIFFQINLVMANITKKGGGRMKNKLLTLMLLGVFLLGIGFTQVSALDDYNTTMTVKAEILESTVSISVPETIIFPSIASGYISEREDILISNTGTVPITVLPTLEESYVGVFENLAFRNILSDPLTDLNYFEFDISRPAIAGGTREETIYMYLDLEDYIGNEVGYQEAEVIFVAVPL